MNTNSLGITGISMNNTVHAPAQQHFGITTTVQFKHFANDDISANFNEGRNYIVKVFRPNGCVQGERYEFTSQAEADYFAGVQRGDITHLHDDEIAR